MRPETCKNCCASDFIELDDVYVCTYCESKFPKTPARELTEIRYVEVPVPTPVPETAVQMPRNGKSEICAAVCTILYNIPVSTARSMPAAVRLMIEYKKR